MRFAGKAVRSAIFAGLWIWGSVACAAASTSDSSSASADARLVTHWILDSHDNHGKPFAVVDKKAGQLHIHAADGHLIGSSPALLGLAPGDTAIPDIARRTPASLRPFERTTPAGRFESQPGRNLHGEDIVWLDYAASLAIHRLRPSPAREHRAQRLASATVDDNRISLGCVVVPVDFYLSQVAPLLGQAPAVVYVLPEDRAALAFFASQSVARAF